MNDLTDTDVALLLIADAARPSPAPTIPVTGNGPHRTMTPHDLRELEQQDYDRSKWEQDR